MGHSIYSQAFGHTVNEMVSERQLDGLPIHGGPISRSATRGCWHRQRETVRISDRAEPVPLVGHMKWIGLNGKDPAIEVAPTLESEESVKVYMQEN